MVGRHDDEEQNMPSSYWQWASEGDGWAPSLTGEKNQRELYQTFFVFDGGHFFICKADFEKQSHLSATLPLMAYFPEDEQEAYCTHFRVCEQS